MKFYKRKSCNIIAVISVSDVMMIKVSDILFCRYQSRYIRSCGGEEKERNELWSRRNFLTAEAVAKRLIATLIGCEGDRPGSLDVFHIHTQLKLFNVIRFIF